MNIVVCIKQVIDPEAPPASFKIDSAANKVLPPKGIDPVISPFDENALEAALKIKDAQGGKITVISLGNELNRDVVKKPLAMGADELILLEDDAFSEGDSQSTAYALAMAIKKIGEYDIIFCGRQAADWDSGQVGLLIAEILDLPVVTLARKIEGSDGKANIERLIPDGYEKIEVDLPAVITVSNELGEPRYPTIRGIMASKKREPIVWSPADIDAEITQIVSAAHHTKLIKLFQPVRDGECEIIEEGNPEGMAISLALKMREAKII
ncbi:electron transfer flavoprotein subunit beta/FixA family protein [Chloroflexota bacterium]